jgi:phosphatidylserine decarboxylase
MAGEKFGMIKFGSRVDVILPVNSEIKVSVNQKVFGGETILAEVLGA